MPDGRIKCPTLVNPENADASNLTMGLLDSRINFTFDVPANALHSMRAIWLWLKRIVEIFWRPAKANCDIVRSGVYWMESSRKRGKPRNANCLIFVMLLPSNDSFFSARRPANESDLMMGKLFLVRARFSTVEGRLCSGIWFRPPVLQRTCNNVNR